MVDAAALTDSKRVRSSGMNWTLVDGLKAWISEMTDETFEAVRPRRRIVDGLPEARKRAV